MRAEVARFNPGDLPGYEAFLVEAAKCYQLGFIELGTIAYNTLGDLVGALPNMARMRGWRSIWQMACHHFHDPKLRIVMSFHPLLIGGNPFAVTCAYSLIHSLERNWGVHSPMGGTGALIEGLVDLLVERHVFVECNRPVTRIRVQGGRARGVELADGEFIPADLVVSNADSAWTYRHLVEPQHRPHWTDRRIEKGRYSMSLFVWYFGTRGQYRAAG